jgi:hypothetical protein
MIRRRILPVVLLLGALAVALWASPAAAQPPGVEQELIALSTVSYSSAIGGPADIYIGRLRLAPGANYGGWHTHPGPVWINVTSGTLTVYGPDGCATGYASGTGYEASPATLYDLRNEGDTPVEIAFAGAVPAGGTPTTYVGDGPTCGG